MKAILLAAGLGTRLRPITDNLPKCLVPIRGKPLLDIWCDALLKAGVEKILVNLHHMSDVVQEHIRKSSYRHVVDTVFEPVLLGTAGTLIANRSFLDGQDGLLIHADNYSEVEIAPLIELHRRRPAQCLMTMLAFRTTTPESCGILRVDNRNVLQEMFEKCSTPNGNLANGALYIVSKELITTLTTEVDFSTEVIPTFLNKIFVVETQAAYIDIGTPENYDLAQVVSIGAALLRNNPHWTM